MPRHLCAGCGKLIAGLTALDLIDGNRVHAAHGHNRLIAFGVRWRSAATKALMVLGLRPPAGSEDA